MNDIQEKEKEKCSLEQPIKKVIYVILICCSCGLFIYFTQYDAITSNGYIIENDKKELYKSIPTEEKQVWALYYSTYANIKNDDHWGEWRFHTHEFESRFHEPPNEIPSVYYPKEGIYSSHNESLIQTHLSMLQKSNIDAILVPWFGPDKNDIKLYPNVSGFTDQTMKLLMKNAPDYHIKIIPMIPNYDKRKASIVMNDLEYFEKQYSKNEAVYRVPNYNKPLIFIYDIQNFEEAAIVINSMASSFEFVGSGVNYNDFVESFEDGTIGYATFFSPEGFTWCSNSENWPYMVKFSNKNNFIFIPTVSPGYNVSAVSHWYNRYTTPRECSKYYNSRWEKAIKTGANIIMINSFNGWKESTNIEPAQNFGNFSLNNDNWCNNDPEYYLKVTKEWVNKFKGN